MNTPKLIERPSLFIRADATTQIGAGHIMRCIALAQEWQDQGGQVIFLTHCESEPLRQRILAEGFDLVPIDRPHPDPSDLEKTLELIKNRPLISDLRPQSIWLCLDGYRFSPDYQKTILDAVTRLLVIDDMNHHPHYHADILLNQNIHAPDLQYRYSPETALLLGTRYGLLRREFLKYKNLKRRVPEKVRNILVTMGGSDPDNVTLEVIEAIKLLKDPTLDVKIIVGPSNPNIEKIKLSLLRAPCSMRCIENATQMPDLMAWADLSVNAAGSTCWELAFMGVPMLTLILAENQQGIAEGLEQRDVGCNLGFSNSLARVVIANSLSDFVKDGKRLAKMSRNAKQLIDGGGAKRIIDRMWGTE